MGRSIDDEPVGGWCPVCRNAHRPGFALCGECDVALVDELPPLPEPAPRRRLDPDLPHDVVEYELGDWTPGQREELNLLLRSAEVRFGWERGVLTVPVDAEAEVDGMVDDIDAGRPTIEELDPEFGEWEPELRQPETASRWRRLAGHTVDQLLIQVLLVGVLLGSWGGGDAWALFLLFTLLVNGYEIVGVAVWGRTIGKLVAGTRVVRLGTLEPPGWWRSIARWSAPFVGTVILWIEVDRRLWWLRLLWTVVVFGPILGAERRGLHDRVAGTEVLRIYS